MSRIPIKRVIAATSGIHQRFEALTAAEPSAVALVCAASGRITTRRELLGRAADLAAELKRDGLGRGHALAVQLQNGPEFIALFLASLKAGVTFVPIDRDAQSAEVAQIVQQFRVNALAFAANSGVAPHDLRASIMTRNEETSLVPEHAALLKLTSGSTGRPKGIITTEENLLADCLNICTTMQISPADLNLGAIPFSHSYGFSNLVTPLLVQGTAIVFSNDYLPHALLDVANRFGVTVLPGIPLMYEHLSQLPMTAGMFESARTFISAGAPLQASTSRRFTDRFGVPIHTFYGCSESGGISYDRAGGAVERGDVGEAMQGVTLDVDTQGRLRVTSAAVAAGYLDVNPDTSLKFHESSFTTDDLAEFGQSGELRLTGRVGDLINTAGKKVNPREIEAAILQIDGVREVKVFGSPAGARGEVVAAAVVAAPDVTREKIRAHCRAHLSSHKVPRIVKLIESIPLDERGKVKRSALALL